MTFAASLLLSISVGVSMALAIDKRADASGNNNDQPIIPAIPSEPIPVDIPPSFFKSTAFIASVACVVVVVGAIAILLVQRQAQQASTSTSTNSQAPGIAMQFMRLVGGSGANATDEETSNTKQANSMNQTKSKRDKGKQKAVDPIRDDSIDMHDIDSYGFETESTNEPGPSRSYRL